MLQYADGRRSCPVVLAKAENWAPTLKAARNRPIEWPQFAIRPASFVPPGLLGAQELGQGHEDRPARRCDLRLRDGANI